MNNDYLIVFLAGFATCFLIQQFRLWLGRRRMQAIRRSAKYGIFRML
ncbi:hypothetical protein BH09VER1_BH09VER1_28720 [soil metagenome]